METTRTIDELLEQTAWVRRLARSMVSDASSADDLAQEAMLVALRRPPGSDVPLRAWLLGVLRNVAASWRRRDQRRQAREELTEHPVSAASTDELVGQVEVERQLAVRVLALAEPYKRTVLLRYFQGLSSAEIARTTGTPEGTVRWRLKRGLDQLRAEMDARPGGRQAWVVALLPGLRGAPAGGAAAGGGSGWAVLGHPLALLLALFAVTLVVLLAPRWGDGGPEEATAALTPRGATGAEAGGDSAPALVEGLGDRSSRVEARGSPRPPPLLVRARVLDEEGRPLPGALLQAPEAAVASTSAFDGTALLELLAPSDGAEEMIELRLAAEGKAGRDVRARWRGERELLLGDLTLRPAAHLRGLVLGPDGLPCEAAEVLVERLPPPRDLRGRDLRLRVYLDSQLPDDVERAACDADGRYELRQLAPGFVRLWARAPGRITAYGEPLELHDGDELTAPLLHLRRPRPEELIHGRVVDPEGRPLAGARVEALRVEARSPLFADHMSTFGTETVEGGSFTLVVNPQQRLHLGARGPLERFGDSRPIRTRGGARELELELLPRRSCLLRARSPEGARIEAFALQVLDEASGQRLFGPLRGDPQTGELRFDVPTVPFLVRVGGLGQERVELGPYAPDELGPVLEVTLRGPTRYRGRVVQDGEPVAGALVRFHAALEPDTWRTAEGLTLDATPLVSLVQPTRVEFETDAEGRFATDLALPERLLVRVDGGRADGAFFGPMERAALDPDEELLLELPEPGALEGVVLTDPRRSPAGVLVGAVNGAGRVFVTRADGAGRFRFDELAPGSWQVRALSRDLSPFEESRALFEEWSPREGTPPWDVAIEAGEVARIPVDLRESARVWLEGRVLLGRQAPGPWLVQLEPSGAGRAERLETRLDAEGRFRFDLEREGPFELLVTHCDEGQPKARIEARVTAERGGTRWSYEEERATIHLRPTPGDSVPGARLCYVHERSDGATWFAAFERDGTGAARPIEVPAGPGRVVPFDYGIATRESRAALELEPEPDEVLEPVLPPDALE